MMKFVGSFALRNLPNASAWPAGMSVEELLPGSDSDSRPVDPVLAALLKKADLFSKHSD